MSFNFRCVSGRFALPGLFILATVSVGVLGAQTSVQSPPAAAVVTPAQARQLRLRAETAQLNMLAQQLQQALDKSGDNQLSLDVIRLSEQAQSLARQIEIDLRTP